MVKSGLSSVTKYIEWFIVLFSNPVLIEMLFGSNYKKSPSAYIMML